MHNVILTDRDMGLLKFLWRWKVLSTAAITARFYNGRSPVTAYTRLWHLKRAAFLQLIGDKEGRRAVWGLTSKGYSAIQNGLSDLSESGFKTENAEHDHLVTAFHLGEWLNDNSNNGECFTEQELRRFHLDHFPSWVPQTNEHRPDGYSRIYRQGKPITLAIEVEINQKRDRFYQQLAHFYDRNEVIKRILWCVSTANLARKISRLIETEVPGRHAIHNFITRADFERSGWSAPILLGAEAGKAIHYLFDERVQTSPKPVWTPFLLDTRKCPHRSKSYLKTVLPTVPDRGVPTVLSTGGAD
jgi:hypothetical protein